jgi:hypothetical protein
MPSKGKMISLGSFKDLGKILVKTFFPTKFIMGNGLEREKMMKHVERLQRDRAFTRTGRLSVCSGLQAIIHFISHVENALPCLSLD